MSCSRMSGVGSGHPAHLNVHPINSPKLQKALDVLLKLLSSCAGPAGKIHAVCNSSGGHVIFTSASARLLSSVLVTRPELKLIITSVQSHLNQNSDCGLFMACICLQIVKLSIGTGINFHICRSLFETFVQIIVDYLRSLDCKISVKADLTDLSVILAYVRSIISSKHLLNLTSFDSMKLSELIMKTFVESIPMHPLNSKIIHSDLIHIICVVNPHVVESRLEHGLLLEYPELSALSGSEEIRSKIRSEKGGGSDDFNTGSHIKVALFSCSLSGDMEEVVDATFEITKQQFEDVENSVLDKMIDLCDSLEKCHVELILCQKVIHPKLKVALRSKGILFIDRLGSQKIPYIQDLTGAHPIATVLSTPDFADLLGWVDCVSHVVMNDRSYLHLTSTSSTVVTLILCAQWEEQLAELQSCVKTSLQGLYTVCKEPKLLAGGGCWQTHCSYLLRNKIHKQLPAIAAQVGCTEAQVLSSLAIFCSSLHHWVRSLANNSQEVLVDLSSLHCWRVLKGRETNVTDSELMPCCCGLKSVPTNCILDFDVISGHESTFISPTTCTNSTPVTDNADFSWIILDNISAAVQALERGVFTANLVLSIGVSIIDRN